MWLSLIMAGSLPLLHQALCIAVKNSIWFATLHRQWSHRVLQVPHELLPFWACTQLIDINHHTHGWKLSCSRCMQARESQLDIAFMRHQSLVQPYLAFTLARRATVSMAASSVCCLSCSRCCDLWFERLCMVWRVLWMCISSPCGNVIH